MTAPLATLKPNIGPLVPRRGNGFSRWLGRLSMRLLGWKVVGDMPNLPKFVLISGPHTSNMDGVVGISFLIALGIDVHTMIKDSAFKGLLGKFLLWAGAIPIDRKNAKGVIEQSVDAFISQPKMAMLVAPEGTRHASAEWKKGYYYIALKAGVPILPAAANYNSKRITFGPVMMPSGDYDADFAILLKFFAAESAPRWPDRLSLPLCEAQGQVWKGKARAGKL